MCIAYLAIAAHPDWPLFIAANRDEFHARPSKPAAPWDDHPKIIAGLDLQAQGSWLGLSRSGKFALVTNYRDPASVMPDAPSRGDLVRRFLTSPIAPRDYACGLESEASAYNGFNLIVGDRVSAWYLSNRGSGSATKLGAGRYVLSNHLLDTPWPKAQRLREALDTLPMAQLDTSLTPIFEILKDTSIAGDEDLPDTGLALDRERLLSSAFIISPEYGTRCSTIVAIHASGRALFSEQSYDAAGRPTQRHDWPFCLGEDQAWNGVRGVRPHTGSDPAL
ncbi:NRDE family protein [Parapusillimonas sp. JC17]|uniref:NRDE family protein n=1 Tax=Parapusillimonas sp. JC17 TaxID=3445768 RepID=UPI003FA15E95